MEAQRISNAAREPKELPSPGEHFGQKNPLFKSLISISKASEEISIKRLFNSFSPSHGVLRGSPWPRPSVSPASAASPLFRQTN